MSTDALLETESAHAGVVNCAAYVDGRRRDLDLDDIPEALRQPGVFVWIGLFEPDALLLKKVQRQFGLHDLAIEDAHTAHQRPKLEQYGDSLFVVLRTAQVGADTLQIDFGETHVFVGRRYLVSVRQGSRTSHATVRARCEASPHLLARGPAFILHALMDFVVDNYFPVCERLEDELEKLEDEIFTGGFSRTTTQRIYELKRTVLGLKHAVLPLVDVCSRLTRYDVDLIPEDTRPYFRDVYDHVVRLNELLDGVRELLGTALEANLSLLSVKQNEDTKRLAGWAAIIAVPTMVAGLYGMNFQNMPELHWRFGYPVALGVMFIACAGLYAAFRRSGWL